MRWFRGLLLTLLAFALLLYGALCVADAFGNRVAEDSAALLREAVERAATTCYAVEGRYPKSLDYLEEHYGLAYDREKFVVSYDAFASNVLPGISVLARGGN